jgi:hypothetical protein
MLPHLTQALAVEHTRDLERAIAASFAHSPYLPTKPPRRSSRVSVRCGYWLISIGWRLAAPDLSTAAR